MNSASARIDGPLHRRVAFARSLVIRALFGEAFLLGVGAGMMLLCAALWSGTADWRGDPLVLAGLGGVLVAILWVLERWPDPVLWNRSVDERLALKGRLLAGLQVEEQNPGSEVGGLLCESVAARMGRKALLARAVPVQYWALVFPFLGGAMLFQSISSERSGATRWNQVVPILSELHGTLESALEQSQEMASAESEPGAFGTRMESSSGVHVQRSKAIRDLASEVRQMAVAAEADLVDAGEWSANLGAVESKLDGLGTAVAGEGSLDATLERAQDLAAGLRERLEERGLPIDPPVGGDPDGGDEESGGSQASASPGSPGEARGGGFAQGTNSGPANPVSPSTGSPQDSNPGAGGSRPANQGFGPEAGGESSARGRPMRTVLPSPLPRAYQDLVQRWMRGASPSSD